jgi:hypothetical protein
MILFTWITTFLCLLGTVLNVKKNIWCFYIWSVANILWLAFDIFTGIYSRALLDFVQLIFALWGIKEWRKK